MTESNPPALVGLSKGLGPLAPTVGWWKPATGLNTKPTLTMERPPGICYAVCLTIEAERAKNADVAAERERCARVEYDATSHG